MILTITVGNTFLASSLSRYPKPRPVSGLDASCRASSSCTNGALYIMTSSNANFSACFRPSHLFAGLLISCSPLPHLRCLFSLTLDSRKNMTPVPAKPSSQISRMELQRLEPLTLSTLWLTIECCSVSLPRESSRSATRHPQV